MLHRLFIALLIFVVTGSVSAQDASGQQDVAVLQDAAGGGEHGVSVQIEADSTNFLIGEWIPVRLQIRTRPGVDITMPAGDADFENADFISLEDSSVERSAREVLYRVDLIVTVFDTGSIPVRALLAYTVAGDTTSYTAASNTVDFTITTVEIDTAASFRDIRDVMDVSLTIWDYLLYAGILLLLAFLTWYGWRRYKNRSVQEETEEEVVPSIPVFVLALERLTELEDKHLWQDGAHKRYQSELTDILREYIEHRYDVPALEETTPEIIAGVAMHGVDPESVAELERMLQVADFTKFAKYRPSPEEHRSGMVMGRDFVEKTRDADQTRDGDQAMDGRRKMDGVQIEDGDRKEDGDV